jgi:hypothetical protein
MIRRLADRLLARLIRLSPPKLRDWGAAMRAELAYIKSGWAAFVWAVGAAGFLLRRSVADRFKSLGHRANLVGGGIVLPVREGVMQKSGRWIATACLGLSLLFFLAPAFRQALDVAVSSWHMLFGEWGMSFSSLNRLAEQARERGDAAGLAFVAMRLPPGGEGGRLADEAVGLDPRLTWIYVAMVLKNLPQPRTAQWITQLRARDPDNAVPHLLEAARFTVRSYPSGTLSWTAPPLGNPLWQTAMAAAFSAPKYESYLWHGYELDCAVIRHYGLSDPLRLVMGESARSPYMALHPAREYALVHLIGPGQKLESQGKFSRAAELYWTAAHFAERVQMDNGTESERSTASRIQIVAYERLQALAEKSGNTHESALFKYQIAQLSKYQRPEDMLLVEGYRWYAMVTQVSFLSLLLAGAMAGGWALHEALRRWSPGSRIARLDSAARLVGMSAAVVMFASCVALYVSYYPYAERFRAFTRTGNPGHFRTLSVFLNFLWVPLGIGRLWNNGVIQFYFWWTSLAASALVALAILLRHITRTRNADAAG